MTRSRLSDSELAALAARIQQNYDYDDRSGKLINRQTGNVMRGSDEDRPALDEQGLARVRRGRLR